jgi:hypothetical protein
MVLSSRAGDRVCGYRRETIAKIIGALGSLPVLTVSGGLAGDYQMGFSADPVRQETLRMRACHVQGAHTKVGHIMQNSTKTRAVVLAGAALVAAGAFTTALGAETSGGTAPTVRVNASTMSVGASATTTTPVPTAIPTPMAQPALKATVPCGFTSSC